MIYTPVYYKTMEAICKTDRFVSSRGGTRSGKTFANLQSLFELAVQDRQPTLTSVVSETFPHLKRGAIRDFQDALGDYWQESCWSKGESIYTLPNGSQIEFFSADAPAKVHGPARDRLFLNEIQNIPYETARQLFVRTRGLILMDYNPTASFWGNEQVEVRPDCVTIESTYLDNSYLTPEQVREIEANQSDANWWTVYGLGKFGTLEGLIYTFEQIDEMPDPDGLREVWGMDFGFTCFQGDTLITTARGDIPIRDVVAGDLVLTRQGFQKVLEKKYNGIEEVIEKNIIFVNGESARISATYNHNFNVNGKWKQYGKLEKGDMLFTVSAPLSAPIASLVISSVEEISRHKTDVYDLWVDGVHEYFANGILVHNCDPTAIVRILADTGRKIAYIDEQAYDTGMLNAAIASRLLDAGARSGVNIWADAAEPKSIAEIGNASGLTIRPCDKGAPVKSDKRKFQIQWMQGWQLRPTKRSVNWIKEARNYTWAKDRNGNLTGFPIDGWDHLMDATRYALFSEFADRAQEGQYSFTQGHRKMLRRH